MHKLLTAVALACAAAACATTTEPKSVPIRDDLGSYSRPVTTSSAQAQRYFDQGLLLCYGFDHELATENFARAAEIDPTCAMAYWGIAFAAGPNINNPAMDEAASKAAFDAIRKAQALSAGGTATERDLIRALSARYAWPPPADRKALDQAYADAMRDVWRAHPDDADVGALFAESLMDLRPWDLWTPAGEPQPGTLELIAVLATVRTQHPDHPGANHDTIHTLEASPHPQDALPAADRLPKLVPGAGHLVHMPSHIYIRTGRYADAVKANQDAIEVDRERVASYGAGGFYAMYRAHNFHFLVYAAMFQGQSQVAIDAARETVRTVPMEVIREYRDLLEGFLATPMHALVRFGRWQEILAEPEPAADLPVTTAMWHYARGIAYSALGDVPAAEREQRAFETAAAAVPETATIGNNPARTVLAVGQPMLAGELAYRRGDYERAFTLLREAVARDEALHYDEPWGWMMPASHALGALLLDQDRVAEAEQVYLRDLELHPNNGWALFGLEECLRRSGKDAEADAVAQRFRSAWAHADVELHASCFCSRPAATAR